LRIKKKDQKKYNKIYFIIILNKYLKTRNIKVRSQRFYFQSTNKEKTLKVRIA